MRGEERLGVAFAETHPDDAARVLGRLAPEAAAAFLRSLRPEVAGPVVERMPALSAGGCLT